MQAGECIAQIEEKSLASLAGEATSLYIGRTVICVRNSTYQLEQTFAVARQRYLPAFPDCLAIEGAETGILILTNA